MREKVYNSGTNKKIKNGRGLFVFYDPTSNIQFSVVDQKEFNERTMGTKKIVGTSYANKIDGSILKVQYAVDPNNFKVEKNNLNTEIDNNQSRGFLPDGEKRNIIKSMDLVDGSGATNLTDRFHGDKNDLYIVLAAGNEGIALVADWHEVRNAYDRNIKFVYLLDDEEKKVKEKIGKGEKEYRSYFISKLKK
jgi:hypothetical protein